tara:strand:- start:44 stop:373 length:330 start_codon:yes stop_codon:yes gene_type:complete
MKPDVKRILTKLSENKVELAIVQDADKIYDSIVKGTQRQVSILKKVESDLNKLEADAKRLQKLEQTIEKQAKELGVDIDQVIPNDYAASTWVSDLNKYADKIGSIASVL